jgi:hypothetical protein
MRLLRLIPVSIISFVIGIGGSTVAAAQTPDRPAQTQQPIPQPVDASGKWQVSWQARLGSTTGTLQLQQDGSKLKGTFQDLRGVSPLSGTITGKQISFEVQFAGARPYTIHFTGAVNDDKIEGTSQAVNVGGGGAYMGHAGEVQQPEHPWTAKRDATQPKQDETVSAPNTPVKN